MISVPLGPTNDAPTNEGPTNDGPTNEGPTNEGPTNDGPTLTQHGKNKTSVSISKRDLSMKFTHISL